MGSSLDIPTINIIFMFIVAAIAIVIPILLGVFLNKKYHLSWIYFLIGAGVFLVFSLFLEQIPHALMLNPDTALGQTIRNNIWLYALYGATAAGLFEEVGRFIGFKFILKKRSDPKLSLMVGAGHGGFEAMMIVGVSLFESAILAIMANQGTLSSFITDSTTLNEIWNILLPLETMSPWFIFLGIWERLSAMTFHIVASILVFKAVKEHKLQYLLYAFLLHFGFNFVAVMSSQVLSAVLIEALLTALVIPMAWFGYVTLKKMIRDYQTVLKEMPVEEEVVEIIE
ncbi:MAG: YhfC family intramembrane metalloprotease [Bacilli bacterium]|nr:YhfC family intramembrane metalloprotease [Bacilli bacterium]MBN2876195.1 YhfC family intramembrane metalloprotease [Bacilli bacterium]